jgi:6-pyruvoyltetrahydropterin/6-carboxytetrahydropterin synthase
VSAAHRHAVQLAHRFSAAHRLPHLDGDCVNLHGHTWEITIRVAAPELREGVVVELGAFKRAVWGWVDAHLDHGAMLAASDPIAGELLARESKVFRFGHELADGAERLAVGLDYPSVECVAELAAIVATKALSELSADAPVAPHAWIAQTTARENESNLGMWIGRPPEL